MTDEEDMARDARSVACADAPGRDVWKGLADLELEHARSCVRQARQTNHRLLTNMRISRNAGSAECRAAMRPIVAFIRGERSAFMARAWGHRNARNEWLEQAARSESEDTQAKPTQDPRWWGFGEYTGDDCPSCGRMRLMNCEDNSGRARVICEKCEWEPAVGRYRGEVDSTPTQDDVDALVKAVREHMDPKTKSYPESWDDMEAALTPFQKG